MISQKKMKKAKTSTKMKDNAGKGTGNHIDRSIYFLQGRVKLHEYLNFLIYLPFDVLADSKKFQQLTKNAPKMQLS